jgi:hypothetical protein
VASCVVPSGSVTGGVSDAMWLSMPAQMLPVGLLPH